MSRGNKTDAELGIKKFVLRQPLDLDEEISQLAKEEHRAKNKMMLILLREALVARGIHSEEPAPTKVVLPMEKSGPLFWGEQMAYLDAVHLELPDEDGIQCTISFKDAHGVQQTRLVALDELEPYWYYVRRTGTAPKYDLNVSPVPKELL